jgi:peptidoglycan/LPS O-acetylase OafA/YrhL
MVLLGDASYAIYLTHPLTLIAYNWLLKGSLANIPQWLVVPIVVSVCAGVGLFIHIYGERWLIAGSRHLLAPPHGFGAQ